MAKKLLVETTSAIFLMDPQTRSEIHHHRPTVVEASTFLESRIALSQVRVLAGNLKEETTDADFVGYLVASDNKMDLAVESFLAEFTIEVPVGEKSADPAGTQKDKTLRAAVTKE